MRLNLHPQAVWQSQRRNALRLLRAQKDAARRAGRHDSADALLFAIVDIEEALRYRADLLIDESTRMPYIHEAS